MSKIDIGRVNLKKSGAPVSAVPPSHGQEAAPALAAPNDEDQSKDAFFVQVGEIAEAMIVRHGSEFAIGTLVLAAKFVAEGRPLVSRRGDVGGTAGVAKPV